MRAAYLGPEGTHSHAAARGDERAAAWELVAVPAVHDAVRAVESGEAERALVPMYNSIEGGVGAVLDALAAAADRVKIVGERVLPISHALVAREPVELSAVRSVLSHPQALAQSARFLREHLPAATVAEVSSTAEAVRMVAAGEAPEPPAVAVGSALAAEVHGGVVLRDHVEGDPGNVTRFAWLAPAGTAPLGPPDKTSLVFWGEGDEAPGWLVRCLSEFAFRGVNLTRIESRPWRGKLGSYRFFVDADGDGADGTPVAAAAAALEAQAAAVRVLGSYPAAATSS